MITIKNLEEYPLTNKGYGGHSGGKLGMLIDNENYLVKFSSNALFEYLGSHIYEIIGIETHKTMLGYLNGKIVVACKDFLSNTEEIMDFNAIKNNYDPKMDEYLNRNSSKFERTIDLDEVLYLMQNNRFFKEVPELKKRFWQLFIIDAFISNNDRNEANWGLIYNKENGNLKVAPVYDNGASFYTKSSDEKLKDILSNSFKFKQMVYDSCVSVYVQNDKIINPLKYIERTENKDCNETLLELFPAIDMKKIKELFDEVPLMYDDVVVFSELQKEVYYKMLLYKYENVLKKVYDKLLEEKNN